MHINAPHVDNTDETGLTPPVVARFSAALGGFLMAAPELTDQTPKYLSPLKFPRQWQPAP